MFRHIRFLFAAGYLLVAMTPVGVQAIDDELGNIEKIVTASSTKSTDGFSDFFDVASYPWQAPGIDDQRSPCAFLNTLANHGLINRNGTFIDLFDIATKMEDVFSFTPEFVYMAKILPAIDCGQTYEDDMGILRLDLQHLFEPRCNNFRSILVRSPNDLTGVNRVLLEDLLMTDGIASINTTTDKAMNAGEYSGWENNTDVLSLEEIAIFQYHRIVDVYKTTYKDLGLRVAEADFIATETLSYGLLGKNTDFTAVEKNRLFTFLMWERLPDPFFRSTTPRNFWDVNDPSYNFFLDLLFSFQDAMNSTLPANEHNSTNNGTSNIETDDGNGFGSGPPDDAVVNEVFVDDFAIADDFVFFDDFQMADDFAFFDDSVFLDDFDDSMFDFDDGMFDFDDGMFDFDDGMFDFDDGMLDFDDAFFSGDDDMLWDFDDVRPSDDEVLSFDDTFPVDDDQRWLDDDFFTTIDDQNNGDLSSFFPSPTTSDGPVSTFSPDAVTTVPSYSSPSPNISEESAPPSWSPEASTPFPSFSSSLATSDGPVSSLTPEAINTIPSFFPSLAIPDGTDSSLSPEALTTVPSSFPSRTPLDGPASPFPPEVLTTVPSYFPSSRTPDSSTSSFPSEAVSVIPSTTVVLTETLTTSISSYPTTEIRPSTTMPSKYNTRMPSISPTIEAIDSRNPTGSSTNIPTEWPATSMHPTGVPSGVTTQSKTSYQPSSNSSGATDESNTNSPTTRYQDTECFTKSPTFDQEDTGAPTEPRPAAESLAPVLTSIVPQTNLPTDTSSDDTDMPTENVELAPTETSTIPYPSTIPYTAFPTPAFSNAPTAVSTMIPPYHSPTKEATLTPTETPITSRPTTDLPTDIPSEMYGVVTTNKPTIADNVDSTPSPHTDIPFTSDTVIPQTARPTNILFTDRPTRILTFAPTSKPTFVETISPVASPDTDFPSYTATSANTDSLVIAPVSPQTTIDETDFPTETPTRTVTFAPTSKPTVIETISPVASPDTDFPTYTATSANTDSLVIAPVSPQTTIDETDFPTETPTRTVTFAPTSRPTAIESISLVASPETHFPTNTASLANTDSLLIAPVSPQRTIDETDFPIETTTLTYTNKQSMIQQAAPMKTTDSPTGTTSLSQR